MWMVVQTEYYYPTVLIFYSYDEAKIVYDYISKKETSFYKGSDTIDSNVYLTEVKMSWGDYHKDVPWKYDREDCKYEI